MALRGVTGVTAHGPDEDKAPTNGIAQPEVAIMTTEADEKALPGPRETWAALAVDHGYADQAHLVREFRAFGAEPPTHPEDVTVGERYGVHRGPARPLGPDHQQRAVAQRG